MEQKGLSNWLKFIMIGIGLCGLVIYFLIVPMFGRNLADNNPELAHCYYPWLIFLWVTAVPCYLVLVFGWKISVNIGKDRSFCEDNAKYLKWISMLAAGDSIFFFVMNIIYMFLGMNHPGIVLASLIVTFIGVAVTVAAAALSHLVIKASKLQEDSDLTI
ncbi:MAG: DUF2975 domain-containing protein [Clostridia bacterium]|nr:DUF2975 domain-containing protein [Clostridia bacterium]